MSGASSTACYRTATIHRCATTRGSGLLPKLRRRSFQASRWSKCHAARKSTLCRRTRLSPVDSQDYDQLLDKRPGKGDAVFAMHQDMAYWPPASLTANDTRTVTLTLAIDDETAENGCIRYVPGSQKERKLRPHRPLHEGREEGHAVVADVADDEEIRLAEVPRGGVTLHDEWVVHGSPGNASPRHRRTYVIAFRTRAIVDAERAAGFTHSHNDDVNWDVFNPEIAAAAARAEL